MDESEYCDDIESNMQHIVERYLYDELVSYQREYAFGRKKVDFYISCGMGRKYIVECKYIQRASAGNVLRDGIMQLLEYGLVANDCGVMYDYLCLFTNEMSLNCHRLITDYNLPITTVLIE